MTDSDIKFGSAEEMRAYKKRTNRVVAVLFLVPILLVIYIFAAQGPS